MKSSTEEMEYKVEEIKQKKPKTLKIGEGIQ